MAFSKSSSMRRVGGVAEMVGWLKHRRAVRLTRLKLRRAGVPHPLTIRLSSTDYPQGGLDPPGAGAGGYRCSQCCQCSPGCQCKQTYPHLKGAHVCMEMISCSRILRSSWLPPERSGKVAIALLRTAFGEAGFRLFFRRRCSVPRKK